MASDFKKYIKYERFPAFWCPGCPSHSLLIFLAQVFDQMALKPEELVIISGIGCTGRLAGYFKTDSIHTLHGRTLPLAEGVAKSHKDLKVVVITGDGDLLSIGGNHLLHSARRNSAITVFMVKNQVYGMTGGQAAPTLAKDQITVSTPGGNQIPPLNLQGIITSNKRHFFARTTVLHPDHLKEVAMAALKHPGFAAVEIIGNCFTNFGRRAGYKNIAAMAREVQERYHLAKDRKDFSQYALGIIKTA